jgi:hypothetical protein
MTETTLTVVTFEPNTIGVYINGDLYKSGDSYMEGDILREIIEGDREIDTTREDHIHFERWEGMPETLDEVTELYG